MDWLGASERGTNDAEWVIVLSHRWKYSDVIIALFNRIRLIQTDDNIFELNVIQIVGDANSELRCRERSNIYS